MKIATLQFAPKVGEIATNFSRAESLLMRQEQAGELQGIDLLVLPELAFTGYNHPSLADIASYLEPTASGPSTRWASRTAKRLKCTVAVGYPEDATSEVAGNHNTIYDPVTSSRSRFQKPPLDQDNPDSTVAYNSLVLVNANGEVVAHTRKAFLYYTDQTWAQEGPDGFYNGVVPVGKGETMLKTTAGICMDINPYKFEAPWTAYEFSNHCREAKAQLVIVSMAWLTRLSHEQVYGTEEESEIRFQPDMDTLQYWIERFRPLSGVQGLEHEVMVVLANRTGEEGTAPLIGDVRYAGSSCVMGMKKSPTPSEPNVRIWDILGRAQEGVLIVDTKQPPLYVLRRASSDTATDSSTNDAETPLR